MKRRAPKEVRETLHALADWIADQLEVAPKSSSPRLPKIVATDDEREFAQGEMRAMTRKRKGRAA